MPFHSPAKNARSPMDQTLSLDEGVSSLLHGYQETRQDLLQQAQMLKKENRALVEKLAELEKDSTSLRDKVSSLESDKLELREGGDALQAKITRLVTQNQALYSQAQDSLAAQQAAESAIEKLNDAVKRQGDQLDGYQRLVKAHMSALVRQEKVSLRLLFAQLHDSPIIVRTPPDALSGQEHIAKQAKDIMSVLNTMTYAWDSEGCKAWSEAIFRLVDSDGHLNHKVIPLLQLLHVWRDLETEPRPIDKLVLDSWIDRTQTALLRRFPEELQNAVSRGGSAPEILKLMVGRTLTAGMLLSAPHPRSALKAAMQVAMRSFAPSGTVQSVSFKIDELESVKEGECPS